MARGDRKTGREDKKPKQAGGKQAPKSDYALRQSNTMTAPFAPKAKKK